MSSGSAAKSPTARFCFLATGAVVLLMMAVGLHAVSSPAAGDEPHALGGAPEVPGDGPVPVEGPGTLTLNGPGDITVVKVAYEPDQNSGWHSHAGIHAVAVLSGTLTVYDGQCRAEHFGPGRPYIGGQELHLARNETSAPVEMVVTYLHPSTSVKADAAHPDGPACAGGVASLMP